MAMYERHGFGLLHVSLRADGTSIGICGILKRDTLEHPDLGYALVPEHWGSGYAGEAALSVINAVWRDFDITRIVAITKPENEGSIRVLERLGFRFDQMVRATPDGGESRLFVLDAPARGSAE
jgi:RimJ/RimL family protein N-acetyltransferase